MRIWELESDPGMLNGFAIDDPTIEPAGPMAPLVGPRLTFDQMVDAYDANEPDRWELGPALVAVLSCIRSFPVPSLIGGTITCPPQEFARHLRQFLVDAMPGTLWEEKDFDPELRIPRNRGSGLVEKYRLLDGSWAAPGDEATGQAMELELGGHVTNIGGPSHEHDSLDGIQLRGADGKLHDATEGDRPQLAALFALGEQFTPEVIVTIANAHWTNVSGLRVGMGYYE